MKPDLVVVFNKKYAYVVKAEVYSSRDEAVSLALSKIREKITEDKEIRTIEIYEVC